MSIKKETKYDITTNIGDKELHLRKWKARDLNTFNEVLDNSYEIDTLELEQLHKLVTPCIKDYNDEYYSHFDLLNLLFLLRQHSLGKEIDFKYLCEECSSEMDIKIDLEDSSIYDQAEYKDIIVGDNTYSISSNISYSLLERKKKDEQYKNEAPVLMELLLRIRSFKAKDEVHDSYTFEDLYEFINDLNIKEYTSLIESFVDQISYFKCSNIYDCPKCGHKHNFDFDIIPGFFGVI